jgi:hypothetical protein
MTQTIPRVLSPGGRTIDPRRCAVQPKPTVVLVVLLAASLFALLGLPARAQLAGKGSIKGSITDPTGAVVPNATVVAISNTRGTTLSTRSTSAGDYELSPLDADVYTVTTTAQGFSKTTQENVRVNALEIANLNVSLQVGSEAETVTVSAAPSPLETSNATLGATMEQEVYSALPIEMALTAILTNAAPPISCS